MKILVTLDNWGLVGGSERYAGDVVEALAARGHELHVLCGSVRTPALSLPAGSRRIVEGNYSDGHASRADLAALTRTARALAPDVIFVLSCFQAQSFQALEPVAPIVRFVQDHTQIGRAHV